MVFLQNHEPSTVPVKYLPLIQGQPTPIYFSTESKTRFVFTAKKKRLNSYERVTHDSKYDSLLGVINSQGKKCKLVSGDGINPYRRDPESISILKPFTEYIQWFQ